MPGYTITDDEELLAASLSEAIEVSDTAQDVFDQHSVTRVLWVPRSGEYDVRALFSTSNANEFAKTFKTGAAQWLASDGRSDVLHMQWNKDVESPSGVFSLTLGPRGPQYPEYLAMLRPGDLVFIYTSNNATHDVDPFSMTLLTIGILERPTRSTDGESGVEIETTHVSGRDLGVIFQETETVFDQAFAEIENALLNSAFISRLFSEQSAGSPVDHILTLLDLIYNVNATGSKLVAAQWQLHTEGEDPTPLASLIDVTTFVQAPMFGYTLAETFAVAQAGTVWNLLQSYANKVVNELFFDVRDYTQAESGVITQLSSYAEGVLSTSDVQRQRQLRDNIRDNSIFASAELNLNAPDDVKAQPVMALVFRQRPYDQDSFQKLPMHEVFATEIHSDELGYSSHDVHNFFRMRFPALPHEYQELIYGVPVNKRSVMRYGLRRMEAESRYMFGSSTASAAYERGEGAQDFTDIFDWYCGLLGTWYAANEEMLSGQIHIRYRPEIRCGSRIRLHRKGQVFDLYCQGVSHVFGIEAGSSATTLTLTRGYNVSGDSLVQNLIWTPRGSGIPPTLDPYGRFTAAGFSFDAGLVRVINQQKDL